MNPILPIQHFVPDAEARQWKDGRMYIYGSYDIKGNTSYCSYEYRVFSSADLIHWEDHGVSFKSIGPDSNVPWGESPLYAPDCVYKDGMYYLYFCMADNSEGVATSPSPSGPFKNAVPVEGAHGDAIDPAVFIDEDGQTYYFWGQYHCRGAKLKSNMSAIDLETLDLCLLSEEKHGFHEGASMRKRNGMYYLIFTDSSRGKATSIGYAVSHHPLGPFEKRGIIIDNEGCDPESWNNHGSIAEFNGDWYVFYHKSSQNSKFSRRVCIEPITFNDDGSINEVEMTTQGIEGPINAEIWLDAYRACLLSGNVHTKAVSPYKGALSEGHEVLSFIHNDDWAAYKYIDFREGVSTFEAQAGSLTYGGQIEIRLQQVDGPLVGVCEINRTNSWDRLKVFRCPVDKIQGVQTVYLMFKGIRGRLFDLDCFRFVK